MSSKKVNTTEEKNWEQVIADLKDASIPFNYKAVLRHNNTPVSLVIDIDAGGGFEGGFEFTSLIAAVPIQFTSLKATIAEGDAFRFALHDESVIDRVGKFFGMDDITIGYKEFDKQLIIKTNDATRFKKVFSDRKMRNVFQGLKDFALQINKDEVKEGTFILEFMIDRAILNTQELEKVYNAFVGLIDKLGDSPSSKIK